MKLKIKQKQYAFGSKDGWKTEFTLLVFGAILFLGVGVPGLMWGTFGEPKYRQHDKKQVIPARLTVLVIASILTPAGLFACYQAAKIFQQRYKAEEMEFLLDEVTSYEIVPEDTADFAPREEERI